LDKIHFISLKGTVITQNKLIVIISFLLILVGNYTFFIQTVEIYPPHRDNLGFLFSLGILLAALNVFLFTLFSSKYTTKPLLILVLLVSALTAYFMDTFHVVIDSSMIRNALQTDLHESLDLLNFRLIGYFLLLGVLPSYLVYRTPVTYGSVRKELLSKLLMLLLSASLMAGTMYLFSKHYTSFIREHKPLRYSTNPSYWIYSVVKYVNKTYFSGPIVLHPIGRDAVIEENQSKRLVIMVVGEAARADHFSLNGYSKETNPRLKQEDIINYPLFYSCGTSTAESVPCMFSRFGREDFSYKKGISYENVLDILKHTGKVSLLWRDNNSDSKGVALRIAYQDYKTAKNNTLCEEGECRDEGMLTGLDQYISDQNGSDILIVLHQMGNHGPAYYKRYPKAFEQFSPLCKTNQVEQCSKEEISNAYDNALRYTDTFLAKIITFLKQYNGTYQASMLYIADHGESLGENGVYLHGMPYFMAPDAQKHVGALLWINKDMQKEFNKNSIKQHAASQHTQDALFHTLLGLFRVKTKEYNPRLDLLHDAP